MNKTTSYLFIIILLFFLTLTGCGKETVTQDIYDQPGDTNAIVEQPAPETVNQAENNPEPVETSPEPKPEKAPAITDLNNKTLSWYFVPNSEHRVPNINGEIDFNLADYDTYYVGSTEKVVFLTFDEGYENGYTPAILDVLKENRVPAAFFATETFLKSNPELVKRMVDEGHIVGNHSKTHPSMPSLTGDQDKFNRELEDTATTFKEITGKDMPLFFRPPRGEFSEKTLSMASQLGYKNIFWSFAYQDWLTDNQPNPDSAFEKITGHTHNGAIILLHAVSRTNAEILDRVIKDIREQGYEFKPLTEI